MGAFENIIHSVRTGSTGFEKAEGMRLFDDLAEHPEDASICSETMVGFHGDASYLGQMLDMAMLVLVGGRERTEAEYVSLLGKTSFRLNHVVATESLASVLEAVLA